MKRKKTYIKPKLELRAVRRAYMYDSKNLKSNLEFLATGIVPTQDPCPNCCLLPGTLIYMGDGTRKKIENVQVGDTIYAYNINRKTLEKEKVLKLHVHPDGDEFYYVINHLLRATANHPVFVNEKIWKRVDELIIGDIIIDEKTQPLKIISLEKKNGAKTVYNLELEGPNNNYFGDNILLHNRSPAY
jgi:hypothetical protein